MSKKVLIMFVFIGGGYNRVVLVIKEEFIFKIFDGELIECEIIDSLKLVNNIMDKIILRGYEKFVIYIFKVYGSVYRLFEINFLLKNEFKDNLLIIFMVKKFKKFIRSEKLDLIIGMYFFLMIVLSILKKNFNLYNNELNVYIEYFYKYYINIINVFLFIFVLIDYIIYFIWI